MIRALRRDLGSQFRQSRNLNEPLRLKCRRAFWAVVYLVKALKIAVRAMAREQLGSAVVFEGQRCFISNWANGAAPTLAGPCGYRVGVSRERITNVIDARELWHRFEFGFDFYMGSWHGIDVNRRLYGSPYSRYQARPMRSVSGVAGGVRSAVGGLLSIPGAILGGLFGGGC